MTSNDAATLLRTYADALEAEHPVPADRIDLAAMIVRLDEEPAALLEFETSQLEAPDAPARGRIGRLVAVTLGLAAAVALLVGYALLRDDSDVRTAGVPDDTGSSLVFEGETVLRVDPLVVTPAEPVEPTFDTSKLGERFQLTPIASLDDPGVEELLDRLSLHVPRSDNGEPRPSTVVKSTLLGRDGADLAAIHVVDTEGGIEGYQAEVEGYDSPADAILRTRWSVDDSGAGGAGDFLPPGDELFMLRTPENLSEVLLGGRLGFGSHRTENGVEPIRTLLPIDVSLDVAVLQYVTDGEPVWTVPIGGVAVVPTRLNEDSVVEVFLYSASGEQIYPR